MKYAEIHTHIVVTGQNSEMADCDNPHGDIYGHQAFVYVEDLNGSRVKHDHTFTERLEHNAVALAEMLRATVQAHLDAGKELNARHWNEMEPRYGSDAYDRGGYEAIRAAEEKAAG